MSKSLSRVRPCRKCNKMFDSHHRSYTVCDTCGKRLSIKAATNRKVSNKGSSWVKTKPKPAKPVSKVKPANLVYEPKEKIRRRTPSVTKISEYWCLYCLRCDAPIYETIRIDKTPTLKVTGNPVKYCSDRNGHSLYHTYCDMGEPECLSCGQFLGHIPEVAERDEVPGFNGQRAHIIPWSVSQDDSVQNVVPLCVRCHKDNPECNEDTPANRRAYLDWLCMRREIGQDNLRELVGRIAADDNFKILDQSLLFLGIEKAIEKLRQDGLFTSGYVVGFFPVATIIRMISDAVKCNGG